MVEGIRSVTGVESRKKRIPDFWRCGNKVASIKYNVNRWNGE